MFKHFIYIKMWHGNDYSNKNQWLWSPIKYFVIVAKVIFLKQLVNFYVYNLIFLNNRPIKWPISREVPKSIQSKVLDTTTKAYTYITTPHIRFYKPTKISSLMKILGENPTKNSSSICFLTKPMKFLWKFTMSS